MQMRPICTFPPLPRFSFAGCYVILAFMNDHTQKTVLVTGGAKRIGAAIVRALALDGWRVLVHSWHSFPDAARLCESLPKGSAVALPPHSLSSAADAECFFFSLPEPVDAIVNNAASFSRGPLADADASDFESMWRCNALVPIQLTLLLNCDLTKRQSQGCVVNLLDQRIQRPRGGDTPYALSKQTLADFTESAARELAPTLRVNAVAPGAILPPEAAHEPAGGNPLGRKTTSGEVAECVRFLLDAPFLTGQILFADSGQHLIG